MTLTCAQARQVDRIAIDTLGIPGIVLMENAARQAAAVALQMLDDPPARQDGPVVILCGRGNNAGDGYAMARHLASAGQKVILHALADPQTLQGDAGINAAIALNMGLLIVQLTDVDALQTHRPVWASASLIVDALLGTGFQGQLRPLYERAVGQCNELHQQRNTRVLAVDIPTGLDGDTGQPRPIAIEADVTVTFVAPKQGFQQPQAKRYLGKVVVCDIGIAPDWLLTS